jgi:hypothetical protein
MKYVIFEIEGMPTAVLFPESVEHIDIAYGLQHRMQKSKKVCDLVSAGFFNVTNDPSPWENGLDRLKVETFGHSQSLNLGPQPGDAEIILMTLELKSTATPQLLTA